MTNDITTMIERRLRPDRFSAAQRRTIDAAMDLFGELGVSGTSFQAVADAVGVTKAAIYHQFKSKELLVLAVAEVGLAPLEDAVIESAAESSPERARALLLSRVVDIGIVRRRWAVALQSDPALTRLVLVHEPFLDLMTRVYAILLDVGDDLAARRRSAVASAAVLGALTHPAIADFDDETLRVELMELAARLFEV